MVNMAKGMVKLEQNQGYSARPLVVKMHVHSGVPAARRATKQIPIATGGELHCRHRGHIMQETANENAAGFRRI